MIILLINVGEAYYLISMLYSEEEELEKLGRHALLLYDEELLAEQTESQYLAKLKEEVQQYQESDAVISSAALASSTDVEYYTYEQREYAKIRCVYSIR